MVDKVKELYSKYPFQENLLNQRMEMFDRNKDIKAEFEYWIETNEYLEDECVEVEGYTAKKIALMSKYTNGETAFVLLVELRENPDKALKQIREGFNMV